MGRIEDIKRRIESLSKRGYEGYDAKEIFHNHAESDIEYLLSLIQIAEEENKKMRYALDKAHVLLDKYESMMP